jgi:formamidopyrimidine-DNA glycosylase
MPELPEVETLKRELQKVLVSKKIKKVVIKWPKVVHPLTGPVFIKKLLGLKIVSTDRRAKVLVITFSDKNHVMIHLKMTGQLIYKPVSGKLVSGGHPENYDINELPNKFTRVYFKFTDGSALYFNDMRKFGWVRHTPDKEKANLFAKTGVEPLSKDFTYETFEKLLARFPKRNLKQFLLDQTLVAGLGNIYVDESCFMAEVLPTRLVGTLTTKEKISLHKNIIRVLKLSISKKGTSAKNYVRSDGSKGGFVPYLFVYGRAGLPCKICKTPISKIKFASRGTHFCQGCQK